MSATLVAQTEHAGPAITVLNFRKYEKNSLKAFCDLHLPSGLNSARLHAAPAGRWCIGLPSKPYTGTDGAEKWQPIIDFESRERKDRLQRLATEAVLAVYMREEDDVRRA